MSKDGCSLKYVCSIFIIFVTYVVTLLCGIVLICVGIATTNLVEPVVLQLLIAGIILIAIGPILLCFSYMMSVTCENTKIRPFRELIIGS